MHRAIALSTHAAWPSRLATAIVMVVLGMGLSACSVKKFAVGRIGDALAADGTTFTSDDDPELVGDALPFSLKLMESLIAEAPDHQGLRLACAKGFTSYAFAYVQRPAEMGALALEARDEAYARATRLYMRGLQHALAGLDVSYPRVSEQMRRDPRGAAARIERPHVALAYWAAASLGLAISLSMDDAAMLGRLREMDALVARALALDESWERGALHEFALTLESARPPGASRGPEVLDYHYERALALSQGRRPGVYVGYAEAVLVPRQEAAAFRAALDRALAIDVYADPADRLVNILAQRRARWLLGRVDDLFVESPSTAMTTGARR